MLQCSAAHPCCLVLMLSRGYCNHGQSFELLREGSRDSTVTMVDKTLAELAAISVLNFLMGCFVVGRVRWTTGSGTAILFQAVVLKGCKDRCG